jgi:predicted dithiol-disulfide oxidoreductase (DUF899 family)
MSLPKVVTREEWLQARKELLAKEKELTRRRDELSAERRRLPMVEVTKEYVFQGPDGEARLLDMFSGRRQLFVGHFMFDPGWEDGCPSCSAGADEVSTGLIEHLNVRDSSLAYRSRSSSATRRRRAGRSPGTRPTAATSTTTSGSRSTSRSRRSSTTIEARPSTSGQERSTTSRVSSRSSGRV